MLDLNTMQVIKLCSDFTFNRTSYYVLGIGIAIISIVNFFIFKKVADKKESSTGAFVAVGTTILFMFIGMSVLSTKFDYCTMATKVIPTDMLTIDQMKKSDKFIKKDGDYYYVKTIKRGVRESDEAFYSRKNQIKDQIKEDFNNTLNEIWFKRQL